MFNIGDRIFYPMHGAGVIVERKEIEILGEKRKYFIMQMPIGDMKVMVPVDSVEEVGVRPIVGLDEIDRVISILKGNMTDMPHNWNRRYRANMDRIKLGDIFELAAVVRNLILLDKEKTLSTGERKMLNSAKQMLVSEIVLVKGITPEETELLIDEYVEEYVEEIGEADDIEALEEITEDTIV